MKTPDRLAMRLTAEDMRYLTILAADLQSRTRNPFVSQHDAVRFALRTAADSVVHQDMQKQSLMAEAS